ncbi:uncharacterized protein BDZ99DRAFT_468449 [Mytilinidion resinicola]|uniref:histone acetyltransferase n=1 Tax=Mytilinidion resinicola TaxID=574789 RepID=A0A6A6Y3J8_9PEZI|nr:uncharacterized protein BDZ99DRAFT_468449 [Mytilinidion resinicola]KAF2803103.1 hypothetical protein BDZ99DRAFT_468449 [Mytilinidion resinicola]
MDSSASSTNSLKSLLAEHLPKDVPFTFYHISTPPSKSPALFSAPPQSKPERTYCESHFLTVSITPTSTDSQTELKNGGQMLILAIEVLIYSTKKLTTVFVSKADSTGCISALKLPRGQAGSPLKAVTGAFVEWLVHERQRVGKRLVVSLFARAQDQYLFPGSVENAEKHVLDDRGLIRWWCRVLDPVVKSYAPEAEKKSFEQKLAESAGTNDYAASSKEARKQQDKTTAKGYLIVPGFDIHETMRHTPSASQQQHRWTPSHPLLQLAPNPAAPPRCLIPHFPDDPKSRFLDELDEELPDHGSGAMSEPGGTPSRSNGMWKSVKSLEQFWDMMTYRQECSSGRCVGFIWVVITPPQPSIPEDDEEQEGESQSQSQSQSQNDSQNTLSSPKKPSNPRRRISTRSGPIPPRLPRIKSAVSSLSNLSSSSSASNGRLKSRLPPESTPFYYWPATSRGNLLFSQKDYARALEVLLQQNFSTRTAAIRSSGAWVREVGVLAGVGADGWGWRVVGRKEGSSTANGATGGAVNILGVRKKRKVDGGADEGSKREEGEANVLGSGLVRKKAKVMEDGDTSGSGAGVNVLSAGLVRKKAKPA